VITKEEHIFHIDQKDIPSSERDQLIADDTVSVRLNRHRELYLMDGVEISIDRIDELGTFLEIEGTDRSAVESVATSLGFRATQFIEHPYDWLKR
jgi:adenylate cyclase class IV